MMTFRVVHKPTNSHARSPYRVVERTTGREIGWINEYLDHETLRRLANTTLRTYADALLHFLRWWESVHHTDKVMKDALTESTLLDYVRAQRDEPGKPSPELINNRSSMLRRLFRHYFHQDMPHAPYLLQRAWWTPRTGSGPRRGPAADLRLKVPPRVIEPLSLEQVQRFWRSFRTARDIAIVGLLLLNGLRSCEVLALELEDLLLSEAQVRVRGKGSKVRMMPLPPETIRLLDCYLKTERPLTNAAQVFVSLKGKARGKPMD